jgi:sulfite exporter TauE/SafE
VSELLVLLVSGLALGVSLGPFCALSCGPLLGVSVAGELGRGGRAPWAALRFLVGRLIAYAAVGAAAGGLLGEHLANLPARGVGIALASATLALGLLLVLFGALSWRRGRGESGPGWNLFCPGSRFARLAGAPFLFGLLVGLSPCPQFLLAAVGAASAANWLGGLLHFAGLYVGSSLFVIPALLVRARTERSRALAARVGSAAAVLVGVFYGFAALRGLSRELAPPARVGGMELTEKHARLVLPEAEYFEPRGDSMLAGYRRSLGGAEQVGLAARGVGHGYCPNLVLVLGTTPHGEILRARIVLHGETPEFMNNFNRGGFLEKLAGKKVTDAFEIEKDLDAVSNATLTSGGAAEAARNAARIIRAEKPQRSASVLAMPGWREIAAVVYLLLVAALLPKLRGKLRLACLAVSVVAMGAVFGRFFSVADLARTSAGLLPGGGAGTGLLLFLLVLAGVTLWRGRVWCSHVCPFGCLTELGGRLTRARARTPKRLAWAARVLPWVTLAAVGASIAWTGRSDAADAEPFGTAARLLGKPLAVAAERLHRAEERDSGSGETESPPSPRAAGGPSKAGSLREWLPTILFALLLGLSLVSMRFYCRHLCGAGAVLRVLARAGARGAGGGGSGSAEEKKEVELDCAD